MVTVDCLQAILESIPNIHMVALSRYTGSLPTTQTLTTSHDTNSENFCPSHAFFQAQPKAKRLAMYGHLILV